MHATKVVFTLASLAGYVAATSPWTVDSSCPAAYIVSSCIDTVYTQIENCPGNDWGCLCSHYQTLLDNCYANCPTDPSIPSVKTTILQYCAAYSATISQSSTAAPSGTATGASSATSSTSNIPSSTSNAGSSSSSSTASSSPTPGAGFAVSPAHSYGALAGFLAIAGAFL